MSGVFFLLIRMQLPNLSPAAESALLVSVLRTFLTQENRSMIIPYIEGIRVTPMHLILLVTSPIAKSEITILLPQLNSLFKGLGYQQNIKTRLIQ